MGSKRTRNKDIKTAKHMGSWRKDFSTELPVIPQGRIVPANDCMSEDEPRAPRRL